MEKIVEMSPAFDKRHDDPRKNYGVHGVDIRMVLKGSLGAVQFLVYTGWMLPHVQREFAKQDAPMPADLGYHSPNPHYDGQDRVSDSCPYLDGGPCYYDGSGISANRIFDVLLTGGSDAVWKELEEYYISTFGELK